MADYLVRNEDDNAVIRRYRDMGDGTHAPMMDMPGDLMTGGNGPNRRMKVDIAQTSFFMGKMFRYFVRLNVTLGTTQVIRITAGANYVLYANNVTVKGGELDVSVRVGCTETGSFSTPITPRRINGMTDAPVVASLLSIATGGGIVANSGTEISAYQAASANGIGNTASTVGNGQSDEIGVANGAVTYLVFQSINGGVGSQAVVGVHNLRWEER